MSHIASRIDPRSAVFDENKVQAQGLLKTLRERMAIATAGGNEKLRERHHNRGKHLVRDRIDRLIDPGTPFLELSPLAAWGQYDNQVPAAGIVTGIGVVSGKHIVIIANDATVKGGSFFHETVKKHVRAQEIAEANRTLWIVAARICQSRTACFPTVTTLATRSIASAGCLRPACHKSRWCSGAARRVARIFRHSRIR